MTNVSQQAEGLHRILEKMSILQGASVTLISVQAQGCHAQVESMKNY
jgi:hypothetical protein